MTQESAKQKRDDSVRFKATEAEKSEYEAAAAETGQSMSNWIRLTLKAEIARLKKQFEK
jgi:hypothetical protein